MVLFQPHINTPPLYSNPPDEHVRYLIPKYISEHGQIPTGFEEEVRIPLYGFSYALYNIFPYVVQGYLLYFLRLFTDSAQFLLYAARFVNVGFGVCMAVVVSKIGKRVFSDSRFRWMFCFAIMYLPQNLFMHTYVNTDSCNLMAVAMIIYGLIRGYQESFDKKSCAWLIVGIILCALSYYNSYGYILSSILIFIAFYLQKNSEKWTYDWKMMLKKGLPIACLVLLGIGGWFIRSAILYEGDFLGLATRNKMAEMYAVDFLNPTTMETYQGKGYTIWQMMQEQNTLDGAFTTFAACYGSMSIIAPIWLYRLFKLFFGASVVGILYRVISSILQRVKTGNRYNGHRLFFHFNMLLCMLIPFVLMLYYAYTMDYQHQGRYLLPILIPLMYYSVNGLRALTKISIKGMVLSNTIVTFASILTIVFFVGTTIYMVCNLSLPIFIEVGFQM